MAENLVRYNAVIIHRTANPVSKAEQFRQPIEAELVMASHKPKKRTSAVILLD